MPARQESNSSLSYPLPQPRYCIGQVVQVNLQIAKLATARIKKIIRQADGVRLLVQDECNEIALIQPWQIVCCLSPLEYNLR
jgi:hypothetical protein